MSGVRVSRGDLAGVDGVHLLVAAFGEGLLTSGGAVSESRSRAVIVTCPTAAAGYRAPRCPRAAGRTRG